MKQSRRIDPLLNRAQDTEDAAARVLADRQSTLAQHEAQLVELRRYADEYGNSQMSATSPAQLANRRAFIDRLQSAVEQQSRAVDNSRQTVEVERGRLLLASRDKQVLEQLAASYRAQERQVDERRSQRELDDLGARRVRLAALAAEGSGA